MDEGARVADAVRRLKGVFTEIPGTRLTVADASRLSGLDRPVCQLLLIALEDSHFLERRRDGLYVRPTTDSR